MYNKIRALIVDDEFPARENLNQLLLEYCPDVTVIGKAAHAKEAKELINSLQPDLVFLDINMPGLNGFDLLESLDEKNFFLVFVTAHNEYGIQAVKANAIDYLLKPISIVELKETIKRIRKRITDEKSNENIKVNNKSAKIVITHIKGFSIFNCEDIIRLEADNNYTKIYFKEHKPITSSKTLKDFEDILDTEKFFRIHKSHLINLNYIKEYSNSDGGIVILLDNSRLTIARRKLQEFLNKIQNQSLYIK
ncbi:MAG TPA: LytTR family DNA-binding domain-containing protein [Ignavibacteriaceae bacterium]|nr:LytTR family DNA-binding domain-containing protein [Ignavibacteriaceae bacterium]